jgi:uncharacterized protein (DUF2267 family)
MNESEFKRQVHERGGLRATDEARRAIGATLAALRCALEAEDACAIAQGLPPAMGRLLERPRAKVVDSADALYAEAERREGVAAGFAKEHVQVVLEVLAEALDREQLARLHGHVPVDIAALLAPREPAEPAPPPHVRTHPDRAAPERQTLARARARPGTSDPIAETAHPLAHAESVARTTQPHTERMVETARSTRPGREDETLATAGRDRSERK